MGIIAWIVIGLIAGWMAGLIMGNGGYGVLGDIIIGIAGGLIGGFLASALFDLPSPLGAITFPGVLVAFVGAILFIVVLRKLGRRRSAI